MCFLVCEDDKVAIEMRDLPTNYFYDKIDGLMKNYDIYPMSPLLGFKRNGWMTGFATFLCKDEKTACDI